MTSAITWTSVVDYQDIRYEHSGTGIAKVTINRPEVHNAFRPQTVRELIDAFARIRDDESVGCVLFTNFSDVGRLCYLKSGTLAATGLCTDWTCCCVCWKMFGDCQAAVAFFADSPRSESCLVRASNTSAI